MADPVTAQKEPYEVEVEQGTEYWWCRCGRSQSQPFCDGSHKGTGLAPVGWTANRSRTVYFCGCKRTGTQPMCDGTHESL